MIRDRNIIKWQGFFMPEHIAMLNQLKIEDYKQKKPELDEHQLDEIGMIVMDSLYHTIPIRLMLWENGFTQELTGIVSKVDFVERKIQLEVNRNKYIAIEKIIAVEKI